MKKFVFCLVAVLTLTSFAEAAHASANDWIRRQERVDPGYNRHPGYRHGGWGSYDPYSYPMPILPLLLFGGGGDTPDGKTKKIDGATYQYCAPRERTPGGWIPLGTTCPSETPQPIVIVEAQPGKMANKP